MTVSKVLLPAPFGPSRPTTSPSIDAVNPDKVVTICSFCRNTLDEMFDEYEIDKETTGLGELLAEYLDDGKGESAPAEAEK